MTRTKKKLTNVDVVLLALYTHGPQKAHTLRKLMYVNRHGSLKAEHTTPQGRVCGWSRGQYAGYFMDGVYSSQPYCKSIPGQEHLHLWERWDNDSKYSKYYEWVLTAQGVTRAEKLVKQLRSQHNCQVKPSWAYMR